MPIKQINHPLVRHKIGLMREAHISTKKFRELTAELARLLAYEACQDFELETVTIEGWAGPAAARAGIEACVKRYAEAKIKPAF